MIEPGRSKGQRPEAVFRVSSKERTLELVHRFRTKEGLFFSSLCPALSRGMFGALAWTTKLLPRICLHL